MSMDYIETLIIGAGQAGLAMSEHLGISGASHLVLEKHRIAQSWRTQRWDSLVANGPAWHDRFPSLAYTDVAPDEFASRESVVSYFESYASQIKAPVRCGVEVLSVHAMEKSIGYQIATSDGKFHARNVVVATGPFQHPSFPNLVPDNAGINQLHSSHYRNPKQLPDGAVLVIGAGSSGSQIAAELLNHGRHVYLSIGRHDRPPRRYRGRDFVWWLGVLGKWDATTPAPGAQHVTIAVSGASGGHTVDFRDLARNGMRLVGLTESYTNGEMIFANDLATNVALGDANYLSVLDEADHYIEQNGLDLPEEPEAKIIAADPPCIEEPLRSLNLQQAGITSIIWATGYVNDYSWLDIDVFDDNNNPLHQRGITCRPGLYFLGLPWLSGRGSSFIWGVWHDAKYLSEHIAKQRNYHEYQSLG